MKTKYIALLFINFFFATILLGQIKDELPKQILLAPIGRIGARPPPRRLVVGQVPCGGAMYAASRRWKW